MTDGHQSGHFISNHENQPRVDSLALPYNEKFACIFLFAHSACRSGEGGRFWNIFPSGTKVWPRYGGSINFIMSVPCGFPVAWGVAGDVDNTTVYIIYIYSISPIIRPKWSGRNLPRGGVDALCRNIHKQKCQPLPLIEASN